MALHPHNPQSYGEIAVIRPDGSDFHILTDNPWEDATPRWAPMQLIPERAAQPVSVAA